MKKEEFSQLQEWPDMPMGEEEEMQDLSINSPTFENSKKKTGRVLGILGVVLGATAIALWICAVVIHIVHRKGICKDCR